MVKAKPKPQLLHLVFGGELKHTQDVEFKDLSKRDIVGMGQTRDLVRPCVRYLPDTHVRCSFLYGNAPFKIFALIARKIENRDGGS